jgi:DNA-binding response OmpR family regulator
VTTLEKVCAAAEIVPGARRADLATFVALAEARTHIVTHDRISTYRDEFGLDDAGLRHSIVRLRKLLPPGFSIVTHRGLGYHLIRPDGWQAPWGSNDTV